jgi:hypothetical protein
VGTATAWACGLALLGGTLRSSALGDSTLGGDALRGDALRCHTLRSGTLGYRALRREALVGGALRSNSLRRRTLHSDSLGCLPLLGDSPCDTLAARCLSLCRLPLSHYSRNCAPPDTHLAGGFTLGCCAICRCARNCCAPGSVALDYLPESGTPRCLAQGRSTHCCPALLLLANCCYPPRRFLSAGCYPACRGSLSGSLCGGSLCHLALACCSARRFSKGGVTSRGLEPYRIPLGRRT